MKRLLRRLWPNTLFPRMLVLIVLALILAQGLSVWLLSNAHRDALRDRSQQFKLRQFVSQVQLLEEIPQSLHHKAVKAWRRPGRELRFVSVPQIPKSSTLLEKRLQHYVEEALGETFVGRVRVQLRFDDERHNFERRPLFGDRSARFSSSRSPHDHGHRPPRNQLSMSVMLSNQRWLTSRMLIPKIAPVMALQTLLFVGVASVLVLLVVFWQLRKIIKPLKSLERAANDLGRGLDVSPLAEEGPDDIKATLRAFNHMNERLQRFVSDRTRMLAALSHDLRTPITSMRLRLEMMESDEHRDKLLMSLDEIQQMSEATLAFVRESGDVERTSTIDFGALLDSLCEDLIELGLSVAFTEPKNRIFLDGRPVALRRALRNIIENAVAYGDSANVSLHCESGMVRISVADQGPGIPESHWASIFEPFYRLEGSRSRETGGLGLGLSIAQQIVNNHGGSIELQNKPEGFSVTVCLPIE